MPPSPSWYQGRAAIRTLLTALAFAPEAQNEWRFFLTRAIGCPAFAVYHAADSAGIFQAFGIQVISLEESASGLLIADIPTFLNSALHTAFGFPQELSR